MAIPNPGDIADPATTKGQMKTYLEGVRTGTATAVTSQGAEALTIATGAVMPTHSIFTLETEGGGGADDLTNIVPTNFNEGDLVFLRAVNGAHVVTVKHNANGSAGVIKTMDAADLVLDSVDTLVLLECIKSTSPDEWRVRQVMGKDAQHGSAIFLANDTWPVPFGVNQIELTVISGGGGGGGGSSGVLDASNGSSGGQSEVDNGTWTETVNGGGGGMGGGAAGWGGSGGAPNGQAGFSASSGGNWAGGRGVLNEIGGKSGDGGEGDLTGGGGGGGGMRWTKTIKAVAFGETLTITIGTGGSGGATSGAQNGEDGEDGAVIIRW